MVDSVLEDVLPPGFLYTSSTSSPALASPLIIPGNPARIRWTIGTLAINQTGSVTIKALAGPITDGAGDPPTQLFTNTATLTGKDAVGASYSNTATATVTLKGLPTGLAKSVDKPTLEDLPGTLTYPLRPTYNGSDLLNNMRVIDP